MNAPWNIWNRWNPMTATWCMFPRTAMWNTALVHAVDAIDDGRDYMLDAVR